MSGLTQSDKIYLTKSDLAIIAGALTKKRTGILKEIDRRYEDEGTCPEHLFNAQDNVQNTFKKIQRFRKLHGLTNDPDV